VKKQFPRENSVYTSVLPRPLMMRSNPPPPALPFISRGINATIGRLLQLQGLPFGARTELTHPAKRSIFKEAEHHAISWGGGDTKGQSTRPKGSNVHAKGWRLFWQAA